MCIYCISPQPTDAIEVVTRITTLVKYKFDLCQCATKLDFRPTFKSQLHPFMVRSTPLFAPRRS